jgi:guanyl-specific ribonuclease Sa
MPTHQLSGRPSTNAPRLLIGLAVVALGLYVLWNSSQQPAGRQQAPVEKATVERTTTPKEPEAALVVEAERAAAPAKKYQTTIPSVTLRDQNGKVIFQGTADVGPTLKRIEQGKKLRFSHDGIVFENREKRLPKQPTGYYHEYVHPTKGQDGPGPQRIVRGKAGETYYTADHYRTFQRLDRNE